MEARGKGEEEDGEGEGEMNVPGRVFRRRAERVVRLSVGGFVGSLWTRPC